MSNQSGESPLPSSTDAKTNAAVNRLRPLMAEKKKQQFLNGSAAGIDWVVEYAEPEELQKLCAYASESDMSWSQIIMNAVESGESPGAELARIMGHDGEDGRKGYERFWDEVLGDNSEKQISDVNFAEGFVVNALAFWVCNVVPNLKSQTA